MPSSTKLDLAELYNERAPKARRAFLRSLSDFGRLSIDQASLSTGYLPEEIQRVLRLLIDEGRVQERQIHGQSVYELRTGRRA